MVKLIWITVLTLQPGKAFHCGACVCAHSRMQSCVTLAIAEAEFVAAVDTAQDMLFTMRVLQSTGLKVKQEAYDSPD